jgi:hypothetical protein
LDFVCGQQYNNFLFVAVKIMGVLQFPDILMACAIIFLKSEQDLIKGISKLDDMLIVSTF